MIDPVSIPPSKSLSISTEPVVKQRMLLRASRASAAVWKSIETICLTISFNFVTLASEIPLTSERRRTVACAILHIERIKRQDKFSNTKNTISNQRRNVHNQISTVPTCQTYRFDRMVPSILKLFDIVDCNSVLLEKFQGLIDGTCLFRKRLKTYE